MTHPLSPPSDSLTSTAGTANPGDPGMALETGFARWYAGDLPAAEAAFRAAVAVAAPSADALGALAELLAETNRPEPAAALFARAVAADPRWNWRVGHARTLATSGQAGGAVDAFRALVAERPDVAAVRHGFGHALALTGQTEAAIAEYREAVTLAPDDRDAVLELAALLTAGGDALAAVELLHPLLRRREGDAALHLAAGRAWIALREPEKARAALERARSLDGDESAEGGGREGPVAEALLAELDAGGADGLSDAYVRALFDRYADRFDADLVGKLGYAAPATLRAAIERVWQGAPAGLDVLDLGCGTGLMGVEARSFARHLAGVDLSPRMVDKARARGLYDALEVGDIVAALRARPAAWDLLVAADVLVYIGELAPVLMAAAAALRPGGRFAATVERREGNGFALGPSRRYAHAAIYIGEAAAAAGLTVRLLEPCVPRRERQAPVAGLVFVLEKP